jgi:hypothetical protein
MVVVARVEVPATVKRPEFVVLANVAVSVKVGDADNTKLPVPVTPVTSVIRASSSAIVSREDDEILPLKVDQSVAVKRPRAVADEFGILRVAVPPRVVEALVQLRSVPVLEVAKEMYGVERPAFVSAPLSDGVKVMVLPVAVMVVPRVRPLKVPVEVARVTAGPVWSAPAGPIEVTAVERRPREEVATHRVLVPTD